MKYNYLKSSFEALGNVGKIRFFHKMLYSKEFIFSPCSIDFYGEKLNFTEAENVHFETEYNIFVLVVRTT